MNRHEALEWAADFIERTKVFEGASLLPAAKLDMISNLANSVVIPDVPKTITKYRDPDPECIAFIRMLVTRMKTQAARKFVSSRYERAIQEHLDALAGDLVTHPPHTDPDEADMATTDPV